MTGVGADFGEFAYSADRLLRLGLANRDGDRLLEHSTSDDDMYVIKDDQIGDGFVFTLPEGRLIETVAVWNYNKPAYTDMGIATMDVAVWTQAGGWKTVLKGAVIEEAEGSDDYDEPTLLKFKPIPAEKIRFENLTAFNPEMKQVGLSAVRFYEPLGNAACNPEPADNAPVQSAGAVDLLWTAGKGAVAHDVYLGQDETSMALLGRVKGSPGVKVSGLTPGQAYLWRVDEVAPDGTVEPGPAWSLTLRDPLIAHWKLDESDGTAVPDSSGNGRAGVVVGNADWRPSGADGGAFSFDGSSYIDTGDLKLAEPVNAITVAAWFKVDVFDKDCQAIVTKGDASWRLSRDGQTSVLHFACNGLEKWYLTGKTPVDDGLWHHAAAVYDGTAMLLYVDGRLDVSQPVTGRLRQDNQPVRIGANSQQADRFWKGMIDDVRIYEYALNPDQIQQLFRREAVVMAAEEPIHLVDADRVQPGEVPAAETAGEQASVSNARRNNLIAVGGIVLVVVGFAAVSVRRKKK